MAENGLIAGRQGEQLAKAFKNDKTLANVSTILNFTNYWDDINALIDDIIASTGNNLIDLKSIVVLDYSFSNALNAHKVAEDILNLENVLITNNIRGLKMYVITSNSDAYDILRTGKDGLKGATYEDSHILLIKGNVTVSFLADTLTGKRDMEGIYNVDATKPLSASDRLKKEGEAFIKENQQIDEHIKELGDSMPLSDLRQSDYADSPIAHRQQLQKEQNKLMDEKQRRKENMRRRKLGMPSLEEEEAEQERKNAFVPLSFGQEVPQGQSLERNSGFAVNSTVNSVNGLTNAGKYMPNGNTNSVGNNLGNANIPNQNTASNNQSGNSMVINNANSSQAPLSMTGDNSVKTGGTVQIVHTQATDDEKNLMYLYQTLKSKTSLLPLQKINGDKGVIAFTGERGSGVSGLVAQTAELYASVGKKVLVLDLDVLERMQTIYFPTFDEKAINGYGEIRGLERSVQGVALKNIVVPVTTNIDLLSESRSVQFTAKLSTNLAIGLQNILNQASNYDIILIDCPVEYLDTYLRIFVSFVDRMTIVMKNTEYDLENLFSMRLQNIADKNQDMFNKLIFKSTVILNKYHRGNRDSYGLEMSTAHIKDIMLNTGKPFDSLLFAGEIPDYEDDWEVQYTTNLRYIWKDISTNKLAYLNYRDVISRLLF